MEHDAIAVVDFGGQYAHLIASKVRRHHILAEILQPEDPTDKFRNFKGIILSGSPALSSHGEDSEYNKEIYDLDIPILGFCFGHQEIAKHYGGQVINGKQEWGKADLHIMGNSTLFQGLSKIEQVWMSHNDSVTSVGPDFEEIGFTHLGEGSEAHRFAAIASEKLRRYGFQFHPEVDDTIRGDDMIGNFVRDICGCKPSWTMDAYLEEERANIRKQVGDNSVFLLASGGVDSTVAARFLAEAIGPDKLHLLHVDNGMMRKGESKKVLDAFRAMGLGENLHFVDAEREFLEALQGKVEPEEKRRAIGDTFINIFEREAKKLGMENFLLGQGTIYPDTVETGGTKRADTIKTHHNRVPIIEEKIAQGKVVEPLADLYKVEVRELGEKMGVPHDMIWRHPFPGPGLGVRALCSDGKDSISEAELEKLQLEVSEVAQRIGLEAFVLPVKSVGVKADLRVYEHPVMIQGEKNWDSLLESAGVLFKTVKGINRCVWNLSDSLPVSCKPLAAQMTKHRLDLLREADNFVMEGLKRHDIYTKIWQFPTVIVPLEIDGRQGELCILRPVHSERAMSAQAAELPRELIVELRESILGLEGIIGLALDLTSKPPGTIEWE